MKLLTWNIQWGRGVDGCVDLDRIVAHARNFCDFDVLCLQEVASGFPDLAGHDGSDQFAGIARRLPGFTAINGAAVDVPNASGGRSLFGNMLLSRFPVLQVFRHLLPRPADPGKKNMQRLALEATLETPQGLVRVTTTHLEYYSVRQRREQVERLRQLHQEACAQAQASASVASASDPFYGPPRGAAAILTGDFNFRPEAAESALLASPIDQDTPAYCDAWQAANPLQPRPPTVGLYDKAQWPGAPFACDFIWVSRDLLAQIKQVRVDAGTAASDHQPMMIELG